MCDLSSSGEKCLLVLWTSWTTECSFPIRIVMARTWISYLASPRLVSTPSWPLRTSVLSFSNAFPSIFLYHHIFPSPLSLSLFPWRLLLPLSVLSYFCPILLRLWISGSYSIPPLSLWDLVLLACQMARLDRSQAKVKRRFTSDYEDASAEMEAPDWNIWER